MSGIISIIAAAIVLAAMTGPATVTFPMHGQSRSGESGSATLTDLHGRTRVNISLKNENTTGDQPAHIHLGSCAHLNPAPKYPLKNVILGHSNTIVDVPMSTLVHGGMAVNVHESKKMIQKYVSCGDIPKK